jgi:hypothetical protein
MSLISFYVYFEADVLDLKIIKICIEVWTGSSCG